MSAVEQRVRAMNPTMRRIFLLDNGWERGRNDKDWRNPEHPGSHTLAAAVRLAIGTEGR